MKNAHYTLKEALPNLEIVTSNSRNGVAKKLMEVYGIEIDEEQWIIKVRRFIKQYKRKYANRKYVTQITNFFPEILYNKLKYK